MYYYNAYKDYKTNLLQKRRKKEFSHACADICKAVCSTTNGGRCFKTDVKGCSTADHTRREVAM